MIEISQRYVLKRPCPPAICYESTGDPRAEPKQHCSKPTLAPTALQSPKRQNCDIFPPLVFTTIKESKPYGASGQT